MALICSHSAIATRIHLASHPQALCTCQPTIDLYKSSRLSTIDPVANTGQRLPNAQCSLSFPTMSANGLWPFDMTYSDISVGGDPNFDDNSGGNNQNCTNCTNCYNCRNCTDCTDCHDCQNCASCTDCNECRNCTSCTNCKDCQNCTNLDGATGGRNQSG